MYFFSKMLSLITFNKLPIAINLKCLYSMHVWMVLIGLFVITKALKQDQNVFFQSYIT